MNFLRNQDTREISSIGKAIESGKTRVLLFIVRLTEVLQSALWGARHKV